MALKIKETAQKRVCWACGTSDDLTPIYEDNTLWGYVCGGCKRAVERKEAQLRALEKDAPF